MYRIIFMKKESPPIALLLVCSSESSSIIVCLYFGFCCLFFLDTPPVACNFRNSSSFQQINCFKGLLKRIRNFSNFGVWNFWISLDIIIISRKPSQHDFWNRTNESKVCKIWDEKVVVYIFGISATTVSFISRTL